MTTTEPTTHDSGFLAEFPKAEQPDLQGVLDRPNLMARVLRHSLTLSWCAFIAGLLLGPAFWDLVLSYA